MRNNPNITKIELSRILGISTTAIDGSFPIGIERKEIKTMLKEGIKAPDFSLPDQNGKIHSLSEYKGQRVIL